MMEGRSESLSLVDWVFGPMNGRFADPVTGISARTFHSTTSSAGRGSRRLTSLVERLGQPSELIRLALMDSDRRLLLLHDEWNRR
jgi:hypothetical protein